MIVVPRTDSRSRPRSRTKSGMEVMKVRFVEGVVFEVGREGLGGGKGAEEELLGGRLFMVSLLVSEGRSGGAWERKLPSIYAFPSPSGPMEGDDLRTVSQTLNHCASATRPRDADREYKVVVCFEVMNRAC